MRFPEQLRSRETRAAVTKQRDHAFRTHHSMFPRADAFWGSGLCHEPFAAMIASASFGPQL